MQYDFYARKKKSSKRGKIALFFTILIVLFAIFILYVKFLVTPLISSTASSQVKIYATKAMNNAIGEAMIKDAMYDDLVSIVEDENGDIKLIEANASKINSLSNIIERLTLSNIQEFSKESIKIPLGAFSGLSFLSGLGPPVSIDIHPYGEVGCRFLSQFLSAGINQTHHKIYVCIDAIINVVLPFKTISVKMNSEVLVSESIIIGKIPDTYLKSNSLSEMLDLATK